MLTVKEMTAEELQALITNTMEECMQDIVEDMLALTNESYVSSIEEARNDYKEGRITPFEDIFDV